MSLLAIETNPLLTKLIILSLLIVTVGFFLRLLKQPHVIIYILTGFVLGPSVLELTTDRELITNFGSLGLVLLLFFIGLEINVHKLITNWKVSVIGTLGQVLISILLVWVIGLFYEWSLARTITLGFVISLSSTAVVIKLLQDRNELETNAGQNALGILLIQDVIIVPMMIALNYMSGTPPNSRDVLMQVLGGIFIVGLVIYVVRKGIITMPFGKILKQDHEMQIFFAFLVCFGLAGITGVFGLSTALGAFVAGIIVSATKSTKWFHDSLYSLRVIFVAMFFISIGMLINLNFIVENIGLIFFLVLAVFIVNNLINTLLMRILGQDWKESFYIGALLSQIGEFSFIIGAAAYINGIITDFAYQVIVSIISISLLLSPFWIKITLLLTGLKKKTY